MSLAPPPARATDRLTIALIGNPNVGKSTLFNALAGMKARTGNYPGVTVEKKLGRFRHQGCEVTLVDLPGTYSLAPRTPDEMVSVDVLLGRQPDLPKLDAVVCIVDASNLERNLYLFGQVRELGLPTVLVLNMADVAAARGISIDAAKLRERLGVPVVVMQAHRRQGLEELKRAIAEVTQSPATPAERVFPDVFYAEGDALGEWLSSRTNRDVPSYLRERLLLDVGGQTEANFVREAGPELAERLVEARKRLAASGFRVPAAEPAARYRWAKEKLAGVLTRPTRDAATLSDRIDRVVTHRVFGLALFAALMVLVFISIFSFAEPLMGYVEAAQEGVADAVAGLLAPGPLRSLLVDGVIAGVGSVLVFLPQIALLFLFIAVLEDCGYMARAAFVMDKLMTRLGLSGKSFVPLMSSFACAIPGIMATRVIENYRDRMVTILIAPLMSCSARLPVYTLLTALFIPASQPVKQGLVLFAMYSLGVLVAIPVAWLLKKTWFKGETPPFVLELPGYQWPNLRNVLFRVYDRSKAFVVRAGTLIFAASVLIWAAGYFPGDRAALHAVEAEIESLEDELDADDERLETLTAQRNELSSHLMEQSLLGRAGHAIEPIVRPLGWDWRIGIGALASFPAREVIIATLGTIYSLGGEVDEESDTLKDALRAAEWPDGRKVYTVPVALSVMVFFALCAQCVATLIVIRRETNSWFWPVFTFTYMTVFAYLGALLTYQIGSLFLPS
jgi:ferrous iron transport protein B